MLNPETITVLDPACGSGHILVVAYDVLKAIYLERGYRPRDIPRLILEKNLYGLDIDDRAAQLAGFALLMKARADDRRLFDDPPRLNVLALQESKGLDADELTRSLQPIAATLGRVSPEGVTRQPAAGFAEYDLFPGTLPQMSLSESVTPVTSGYSALTRPTIAALIDTFAEAKTFGSLIQVPPELATALPELETGLLQALDSGDVFARAAAVELLPLTRQARMLAMRFDAVVTNPPYMGSKGMNPMLKDYAKATFPNSKSDLFSMFMERGFDRCKSSGFNSMVTMQSWMFLSSFENMRTNLFKEHSLSCMVHMGNGVMGIAFGTAATVFLKFYVAKYEGSFSYCGAADLGKESVPMQFPVINDRLKSAKTELFTNVPGSPLAYWISEGIRNAFLLRKIGYYSRFIC